MADLPCAPASVRLAEDGSQDVPWTEADRLAALSRYAILDTPREAAFDNIAQLAAEICEAPIAVVNLIAGGRQWFKAEVGIGARELPLEVSICRHALLQTGLLIVPDLSQDCRFECNPLVTQAGGLRFYAGALLETSEGLPLGTMCILDTKPRPDGLTAQQQRLLQGLARQVMSELELRRALAERDAQVVRAQASETRFRAVFDQAAVGMARVALDGRFLEVNDRFCAITGYAREDLTHTDFLQITHPDDLAPDCAQVEQLLAGEIDSYSLEKRYVPQSGGSVWVNLTGSLVRDAEGCPEVFLAVIEDISVRKAAEEELLRNKRQLRLALEAGQAGTWSWDATTGVLDWDERTHTLYGFTPEEQPGFAAWRERVHAGDREAVLARLDRIVRTPGDDDWRLEYRVLHPEGERWLLMLGHAERSADGRLLLTRGLKIDITERKRVEQGRQLLVRELDHRVKNLFAVTSGMIRMTARTAQSPREMADSLSGRLAALGKAHSLIQGAVSDDAVRRERVVLHDLVTTVLAPHLSDTTDQLRLKGPALQVGPQAAANLALVLHELATNSVKYGALSTPKGKLKVAWQVSGEQVTLAWSERGGPEVIPPAEEGFGSKLARQLVCGALGGDLDCEWRAKGLLLTLTLRLDPLRI
ncbi:PAS domain S-box protein [Rubellimicrobium rubrum]|uniref:histidine kinase n=1 Tax=Rubellimicrobium rubrum TaxID=2585369 RepID=A0A5C4MUF6_9RHOB|nr:PAS domain S-box protein [Rubellimicrobium rubrum]TNC47739.1 PAS domain S-box protein [Rubellimicrobium rubrum]